MRACTITVPSPATVTRQLGMTNTFAAVFQNTLGMNASMTLNVARLQPGICVRTVGHVGK